MTRLHINIPDQLNDELKREQARSGLSTSEIIRYALRDYFAKIDAEIVTREQAERVMSRDY
jgi:metal-responsive CopG/Arc/MetJ family transcriptional regulator